mmetsp:Transcript_93748/g.201258  ORF Transcript_93748/g.201258 Transcript_93748/m.201258 type:complete len:355 (+) Transcript_93748:109-1173(+)
MGSSVSRPIKISDWIFPLVTPSYDHSHELLVMMPSEVGVEVPAMLLAPPAPASSSSSSDAEMTAATVAWRGSLGKFVSTCVIYFHANACDIGQCIEDLVTFRDGALEGDAVVLCPEYPGYGLLRDYEASVAGIDRVAMAAWQYCLHHLGFRPSQIMLFGRSIGTGPATALAHVLATKAAVEKRALQLQMQPRPVGALVLLAPFISVGAVVEYHCTSKLVASLVGPLWNILEMVMDSCMEEVPLLVIHPQADEVVPGVQGRTVYEKATCLEKFGVWLTNASHNLVLLEEHLALTRGFLGRLAEPLKPKKPLGVKAGEQSFGRSSDARAEECERLAARLFELGRSKEGERAIWLTL